MTSKIRLEIQSNGNLLNQTTDTDKIIQGSVAVTEYHLTVKSGIQGDFAWRQTDVVYMSMTRPDGQTGQVKMTPSGTGWVYTSNGWETDTAITESDILEISFICRRYSTLSIGTVASERTSQKIELPIVPSTAFTPRNINITVAEQLEEEINALQIKKVDRVDVDNLVDYPEIQYGGADGIKTPNAEYYNYVNDVKLSDDTTVERSGFILVGHVVGEDEKRQIEVFHADDGVTYSRIITIVDGAVDTVGEFKSLTYNVEIDKQDKTDNGLNTIDKTVVGAINEVNTDLNDFKNIVSDEYLKKNFNILVERTYAQLADFVAIRSGDQTLKMTLQTLRTYLTQGLVGLSFQIMELLPLTGVGNIFYLIPMVDTIEHFTDFADFPSVGEEKKLYIADDEHTGGATGWYNWDTTTETYVSYNLGYYEYIWLEEISKFELIGSTQVDLTGYATETWVTSNFVTKTQLNGGTTGQVLTKKSDTDLDVEWKDIEMPTISLDGVELLRDPAKTYLVIKTPADFDEFTLLTGTTGSPNYTIEWGDGSSENVVDTSNPTHTYEKAGMYLITISGSFANGIVVGNGANVNKGKMIEVYGGSNYPTSVGTAAFYGCTNLTTASLPNVTSFGNGVFYGCINLITANIPKVTNVGSSAFYGCTNLTNVNLPNITNVSTDAFRDCTNLTTANLPNVTSVSTTAFYGCTNLKHLTLGNVTTTATGTRFTNVKLDTLTISGTIADTDITRIKTLFTGNGGTFSNSYEIKYGLQVNKTPTLDNDAVRKIDLDADNISYDNSVSGLTSTNVQDAIDELADEKLDASVVSTDVPDNTSTDDTIPTSKAVYDLSATKLNINGGTMSGNIAMGNNKITGLGAPVNDNDASNKKYVDDAIAGASGLSIGTLASPSPTQALSTEEADDLLQKKTNVIELNYVLNNSGGDTSSYIMYTDPNGDSLNDKYMTLIFAGASDTGNSLVAGNNRYSSVTFKASSTIVIPFTDIHYATSSGFFTGTFTTHTGVLRIGTTGTNNSEIGIVTLGFDGTLTNNTTMPYSTNKVLLRSLLIHNMN